MRGINNEVGGWEFTEQKKRKKKNRKLGPESGRVHEARVWIWMGMGQKKVVHVIDEKHVESCLHTSPPSQTRIHQKKNTSQTRYIIIFITQIIDKSQVKLDQLYNLKFFFFF